MRTFLLKYKTQIIFWIIFSAIVLYFAPRQHDYYLDDDIDSFKEAHLTPFLVWTSIIVSILVTVVVFVYTKSFKKAGISLLSVSVILAFYLFIFQDIFLGGALFLNRQYKRDTLSKPYVISYMAGTDKKRDNFYPYDLSSKHFSIDRKLLNKLYSFEKNQNDTVILKFDKGLFGIPFQSKPFIDK